MSYPAIGFEDYRFRSDRSRFPDLRPAGISRDILDFLPKLEDIVEEYRVTTRKKKNG